MTTTENSIYVLKIFIEWEFELYHSVILRNYANPDLPGPIDRTHRVYNMDGLAFTDLTWIGIPLEKRDLMAIRLDNKRGYPGVDSILAELNLPFDYRWVLESVDDMYALIIFCCERTEELMDYFDEFNNYAHYLDRGFLNKIEFLFKGTLFMPLFFDKPTYPSVFKNDAPTESPLDVSVDRLISLKLKLATDHSVSN